MTGAQQQVCRHRGAGRRLAVTAAAPVRWIVAALCIVVPFATPCEAQDVRITGVTSLQTVDLRPLVDDSVPVASTTGSGAYRTTTDGLVVRCIEGQPWCKYRRSGRRVTAAPVVQDLFATGWGFGQGISLHAHVRGRESFGDGFLWPRAADHFDAIEAYAQLDRGEARYRLGRQWLTNGLGAYNYDGADVTLHRGRRTYEAFGGISLVTGLDESVTGGAIGAINDLPPTERGYLIGARVATRIGATGTAAGVYQRVIRGDRAGLYSERVAFDASGRVRRTTLDAQFVYDFVGNIIDELGLRASRTLPWQLATTLELRRHRPFFESWTIWGAFAPVGFDEVRGTMAWRSPSGRLALDGNAGWRKYQEAYTGLQNDPLRNDGWRLGGGVEWTITTPWLAYANYDVDVGFGASNSDATAGLRWTPNEHTFLGAGLSSMTNIYEFRLGTGRIVGLSLQGGTRVARDARIIIDAALYTQHFSTSAPSTDWSQRRVSARFEWTLGRDPGESARGLPR